MTAQAVAGPTRQEPRTAAASERLARLFDPGSMQPILQSARRGAEPSAVVAAAGSAGGRPLFAYAQDPRLAAGAVGEVEGETILRTIELARAARAPVVAWHDSAGARLQEGVRSLAAYGRIFRAITGASGTIPQISIVAGVSAGGCSYSAGLTDFVVMARPARMFLTGPRVVQQALGETVTAEDLGGPAVHAANGVAHLMAASDADAARLTRRLLGYLPQSAAQAPPAEEPRHAAAAAPAPDPGGDVLAVIASVVDADSFFELASAWAPQIVVGLGRIDGRVVGIVANQPRVLDGMIDRAACEKAAWFVGTASNFGIPLALLVDTPGFVPGEREERAGIVRYGADLLHVLHACRVPRITVVLRRALGGGYVAMNSKDLGADYVLAWSQARIGVLTLPGAGGDIALSSWAAARDGLVDKVIEPAETRTELARALDRARELR